MELGPITDENPYDDYLSKLHTLYLIKQRLFQMNIRIINRLLIAYFHVQHTFSTKEIAQPYLDKVSLNAMQETPYFTSITHWPCCVQILTGLFVGRGVQRSVQNVCGII